MTPPKWFFFPFWCRLGGLKSYVGLDLTKAGYAPDSNPHYVRLAADGKTAVLTLNNANKVGLF
jgi:hypothetical protein